MKTPLFQQTEKRRPIRVPPIEPEKVAVALRREREAVQAELRQLEEAKLVSQETMQREVSF
jgi:predicted transcriptional regulator